MAISTKTKEYIALEYAKYFGRTATESIIDYYGSIGKTSKILNQIIKDADIEQYKVHGDDLQAEVHNTFQNLFSRNADNKELQKYVKVLQKGKNLPINSIVKKATKFDKDVYNNKQEIAKFVAKNGGGVFDLSKVTKANPIDVKSLTSLTDLQTKIDALPENSNVPSTFDGETYMLTAGVNTGKDFVGTEKGDVFNAVDNTSGFATWTIADSIDGGAGIDTFNVITDGDVETPFSASVTNVENMNVTANGTVTLDTTGFTGLTTLNTTSKSTAAGVNANVTAAATTDVNVNATSAAAAGAETIDVNGGKNVTVVSKNNVADTITVGATTAAAGKVSVTSTGGTADTNAQGAIKVNGGTEITVNQYAGNAAKTSVDTDGGDITVTGNASTTTVTVNQTAFGTGKTATPTVAGVVGYQAGKVTITADANATTTTDAGTITTVTLKNYDDSTINSGALTTVNLEGTAGTLGITAGALTTAKVDTLGLNLKGVVATALSTTVSTNTITVDNDYKTLNVKSSTTDSTLTSLVANGATTINVSGDAALTLTDNTFAAAKDIVVTNTAGVTFGTTAIGADVTFTGGAGADSIILSNSFTKAITMGAGNDTVTYGGAASTTAGKKGSVNAGDGEDTIVMTVAQANNATGASANSVFNGSFSGFEVLKLNTITADATIDLTGINGVSKVTLATAIGDGLSSVTDTLTINNLKSDGTVRLTVSTNATVGAEGLLVLNVKDALFTNTDVLNLELSNTGILAAGSITAANVETININVADAATLGSAAVVHTANLTLADATTITVAGNNGLDLSGSTVTKVTNFDASGVVANNTATTTDTAANLAVTFTSGNATAAANVSIKGGAGNDVLTGNGAIDTITGGAGNDTLAGAAGADIINVGEGRDAILINSFNTVGTDSGTASFDTINGFKLASAFTTSTDISDVAKFQAATVGGANASVLGIDMDADGANTTQAIGVKGNTATAQAGQAIGVNYVIKDGILTLGGTGASSVDTLGEWLTEANAAANADGDILAFQFGSDTYVFGQNGNADVFVKLAGVTGVAALAEGGAASTGVDNTLWFVDIA